MTRTGGNGGSDGGRTTAPAVVDVTVGLGRRGRGRRPLDLLAGTVTRSGAPTATAVIGREAELSQLERTVDDAVAGRGTLVLIAGEAGIGKTRLADEIVHRAAQRDVTALRARCWEGGGAPALYPWGRLLRAIPDASPDVATLLRTLTAGAAAAGPVGFELLDALAGCLLGLAVDRPLLVVVEDLHAADTATLTALHLLADALPDVPLAFVGTYREEDARRAPEVSRALADLGRRGCVLRLMGLEVDAVAAMLASGRSPVPPRHVVERLTHATGGNPFFIEQIAPLLDGTQRSLPIPEQVREVIRWRLEPLDDEVRDLLATGSVLGPDFDMATLSSVTQRPAATILAQLAAATASGLVRPSADSRLRYGFVHSLVRETLYEDLPADRRHELHLGVAELLSVASPQGRVAELAHHRLAALPLGDANRAVIAARTAAARACELCAYDDAAELYRRVVQLIDAGLASDRDLCGALLDLGAAQRLGGDTTASRTTFLAAVDLASNGDQLAEAALGYASGLGGHGFVDRGDDTVIALLERAERQLGPADTPLRARVLARLAIELYYTPAAARRELLSQEATDIAGRVGDEHATLVARFGRAWCRVGPDDVDERRTLASELTELAVRVGDNEMALRAEHLRLATALDAGDMVEVDRALERYARLTDRVRQPLYQWHLEVLRAMRAFVAGDLDASEQHAQSALELGLPVQGDTAVLLYGVQLCTIRWAQGRMDEIEPAIRVFVEQYPTSAWRPALAIAATATGRLDEGRVLLDQLAANDFAGIPRDGNWLVECCYLAIPCAVLGDAGRAEVLYELLLPHAGRAAVANAGAVCYGSVSTFLGMLAATAGRTDDARRHFQAGSVHNLAMGHRVMATWTLARQAELLTTAGDRRAGTVHRDATVGARELGISTDLSVTPAADPGPDLDVRAVFRREGQFWTVVYGDTSCHLKDGKGPRYLAQLLANPGQRIAAIDLVGTDTIRADGSAGPALDAQAKAAYQQRLRDINAERDEAEEFHDLGRVAALDEEMAALVAELNRALGLGGRDRPTVSPLERARVSVTKLLKQTLRRLAEADPALGAHLDAAVRTGTFCVYAPSTPIRWEL